MHAWNDSKTSIPGLSEAPTGDADGMGAGVARERGPLLPRGIRGRRRPPRALRKNRCGRGMTGDTSKCNAGVHELQASYGKAPLTMTKETPYGEHLV